MAYERQVFKNNETVLTAEHLNHIEDGIITNESAISKFPTVTTEDNGKFLRVENGEWVAASLTDVSVEGA